MEDARAKAQAGSAIGSLIGQTTAVQRRRAILTVITLALIAFPLIDRNGGDIDAAANACAFAILALGLNIVVGYAGLLDLGYAAFFAIGAYTYGALASWQVQPLWSDVWMPLQWLGLVERFHAHGAPDVLHFTFSFSIRIPVAA